MSGLMAAIGLGSLGLTGYGMFQENKRFKEAEQQQAQRIAAARKQAAKIGPAGRRRIRESFARSRGSLKSRLASMGTGATGARLLSDERNFATDQERAIQELEESLASLRIGVESGVAGALPQTVMAANRSYPSAGEGLSFLAMPYMQQQAQAGRMQELQILSQMLGGQGGGGFGMGYPVGGGGSDPRGWMKAS